MIVFKIKTMIDKIKQLIQFLEELPISDQDRDMLNSYIIAYKWDLNHIVSNYYSVENTLSEQEFMNLLNELRVEIDLYISFLNDINPGRTIDPHNLNEKIRNINMKKSELHQLIKECVQEVLSMEGIQLPNLFDKIYEKYHPIWLDDVKMRNEVLRSLLFAKKFGGELTKNAVEQGIKDIRVLLHVIERRDKEPNEKAFGYINLDNKTISTYNPLTGQNNIPLNADVTIQKKTDSISDFMNRKTQQLHQQSLSDEL